MTAGRTAEVDLTRRYGEAPLPVRFTLALELCWASFWSWFENVDKTQRFVVLFVKTLLIPKFGESIKRA